MKSRTCLAAILLSFSLSSYSSAEGETRIIGNLSTGDPGEPAPAEISPEYEVEESNTFSVKGRVVTIQKVVPPEPVETEVSGAEQVSPDGEQPSNPSFASENTVSSGLIILTATATSGGGYDLTIAHNGKKIKAWSEMEAGYLSGFTEFMANGRRYDIIALTVADDTAVVRGEARKITDRSRRAMLKKSEPAPNYFLIAQDGDEHASRALLKDIHDLYQAEKRVLRWAYHQRMMNQAKLEAEQIKNPQETKDVIIRYWKTPNSDK